MNKKPSTEVTGTSNRIQAMVRVVRGQRVMLDFDLPPAFISAAITRSLGQDLFAPPNVKGWDGGITWITTNTLLTRYNDAQSLVLDSFNEFSPKLGASAEQFFTAKTIDAAVRPSKRGGAFCSASVPALHPYVLCNYNGRVEDVSTVAHELGHAIHFSLARKQTVLNFGPTTPMAETASVFGEMLLLRRLMADAPDATTRRALLGLRIEDAIATVFRQVMYTRWEQEAHARRAQGVVPVDEYSDLWRNQMGKLYGSVVALDPLDKWGWIGIPHFIHSRFYCYSYAFGQLLVLALYRLYQERGQAFDLADTDHTLTITVTGQRNASAAGTFVVVDGRRGRTRSVPQT